MLPSLAGDDQGVFLLTVDVRCTPGPEDSSADADVWNVHIWIE